MILDRTGVLRQSASRFNTEKKTDIMDDIETRLRETSENCLKAYAVWSKAKRDPAARETMAEALHELRKVAARLEIELGASEREEMAQRPIPVPPHRSSRPRSHDDGLPQFITGGYDEDDDNVQPMPQRGQRPQHGNQQRNQQHQNNQNRHQQQRPQQQQPQEQSQTPAAPAAATPGKTVTLERRFGRGRPAAAPDAAAAPAADETPSEG